MKRILLLATALFAAASVAIGVPGSALAAPPPNDDFVNAVSIDPSSLPFSDSIQIDEATLEGGEPSGCYVAGKSIWYSITPSSDGVLRADIGNSSFFDRILYVYRQDGSGFGGLSTLACASPYYNGQSATTFRVTAGNTYFVQVGGFYSWSSGTLNLSVEAVPPPPNDDFANATNVSSLTFEDVVDTSAASAESGEPALCTPPASEKTVWYAYTTASSGSISAKVTSAPAPTGIAAYTGNSINSLTSVGCRYGSPLTFHVDAGTTYYFQVGTFGQYGGQLQVVVEVPPPPVANFYVYPGDPSTFEDVQFYDSGTYDPASAGIASETWDLGDGTTAEGCCPRHRYEHDGDYTVLLTVTTTDGRTASTSRVVQARTHDVAITKLGVPQSANIGQTRQITVGVSNKRYEERVAVLLYKSGPNGYELVGNLQQSVPMRGGGRTTDFKFTYTFTNADAVLGKVTFKAVAVLSNARDALPADNEAVALPTKVS